METDRTVYDRQKQFFEEAYKTGKIGWPREGASGLVQLILEASSGISSGTVLEIGSGEGRNRSPFLERGWRVVAMDLVFDPLLVARKKTAPGKSRRAHFVQGDLFRMPFRSGTFDVVFDFGVYHHLRRPERKIYPRWISGLLKPEGLAGLGLFSEHFRHFPGEVRRRDYVTHRGHHDVFFRKGDLPSLLGKEFTLLSSGTESPGERDHYRIAVYRMIRSNP